MNPVINVTYRIARRITVGVVGGTLVLFGVLLIFLPGPALVVIPVGLAILSLEFAWARHWLHKLRQGLSNNAINTLGKRGSRHQL